MSCILLTTDMEKTLVSTGVLSESGKVLNEIGLTINNAIFSKQFSDVYGKEVAGVGKSVNGEFVINEAAIEYETSVRTKSQKDYKGVDLVSNIITDNNGKSTQVNPDLAVGIASDMVNPDVISSLKEDNDGFTTFVNDLQAGKFDTLPGASIEAKIELLNKQKKGLRAEQEFNNTTDSLEVEDTLKGYLADSATIPQEIKDINSLLDIAIKNTGTEYYVLSERGKNKVALGFTDSGIISISPYNVGVHKDPKLVKDTLAQVYVHEKAHIVTLGLLNTDAKYRKRMEKVHNYVLEQGLYTGNLTEFLAEALSDPFLQNKLKTIDSMESRLSVWDSILEVIKEVLDKVLKTNIGATILDEILTSTSAAISAAPVSPLNGPMSQAVALLQDMDMDGNYASDKPIAEVFALAQAAGFTYKPGKGFFYTKDNGDEVRVNREDMSYIVSQTFAKFTQSIISPEASLSKGLKGSTLSYNHKGVNPYDINTINSIEDLQAVQAVIRKPDQNEDGKYAIKSSSYYRTTATLGTSGVKGKPTQTLLNAGAIGNYVDELGKRIFRGDPPSEYTHNKIAEFVKEEAAVFADGKGEDMYEWNLRYKPPVGITGHSTLENELLSVKQDLENRGITKFYSDLIVWDNDTIVAGEIDILGQYADGSFEVIDLKTRKRGLDRYDFEETRGYFSDRSKHIMQTNTYSNMMAKMGFNMRAPKIIMAQPIYESYDKDNNPIVASDVVFAKIEGDNTFTVIDLERRPEETADFIVNGKHNVLLETKYNENRKPYLQWLAQKKQDKENIEATPIEISEQAKERLQEKLAHIHDSLTGYKNIAKQMLADSSLSEELDDLIQRLDTLSSVALDEDLFNEQLEVAKNFFNYAHGQLQELVINLREVQPSLEDKKNLYMQIKNYRGVFKSSQGLFEVLETLHKELNMEFADNYLPVKEAFDAFSGTNARLDVDLQIALKSLFTEIVLDSYLGSNGEIKMINKLKIEARNKFGKDKNAIANYVNQKRRDPNFIEEVKKYAKEEVDFILNNPTNDISKGTFLINSDMSVNNQYVQIFHKMLVNAETRYSAIANQEMLALAAQRGELNLSKKELKGVTVKSSTGEHFLLNDYDIEFYSQLDEFNKREKDIRYKLFAEKDILKRRQLKQDSEKNAVDKTAWHATNTKIVEGKHVPIDKWKTDYSVLSDKQLKVLNYFKSITDKNETRIGPKSLIESTIVTGAVFYRLPGVLQTQFGHITSGNFMGVMKKKWEEMTQIELDDVEGDVVVDSNAQKVRMAYTSLDGKPIFQNPIFFRGRPKNDQQSLDLFTVYALELQNGIRYEVDGSLVQDATIYLDTVGNSKFFATLGMDRVLQKSKYLPKGSKQYNTISGDASQVYLMIEKMMKNRIYSMSQEYGGEIAGMDINRIGSTIGSYTSFVSMSFKALGAINNWATGNMSALIEGAGNEFYTKTDLAKAKAFYASNIGGIVGDMGAPVKKNMVNQLIMLFDTQGDRDALNNEFERTNWLTRQLKAGTTLAGYSMGEHEVHSIVMLSVLNGQKILNSKGQFLDKTGAVVDTREAAASMLDAFKKNKDGVVELASWAEYSEHDTMHKLSGNGFASVRDLIKDRITRTQGAYDTRLQSELNRTWYGKLFFQFKKHMAPHYLNRFRGISTVGIASEKLRDDQRYFNYSAKTEEYGYYTSFFRFIKKTIAVEKLNIFNYMQAGSNDWARMSDHERANIRKVLMELTIIVSTYTLAMLVKAAADDDDEALWALVYLLRRQTNESGLQYLNPKENWRVMESPMSAIQQLYSISDMLSQLVAAPGEVYETGAHRDENKLIRKTKAVFMLDRLDQFDEKFNKTAFSNLTK